MIDISDLSPEQILERLGTKLAVFAVSTWTAVEVSKHTGIDVASLSRFSTGQRQPNANHILKLALAFSDELGLDLKPVKPGEMPAQPQSQPLASPIDRPEPPPAGLTRDERILLDFVHALGGTVRASKLLLDGLRLSMTPPGSGPPDVISIPQA